MTYKKNKDGKRLDFVDLTEGTTHFEFRQVKPRGFKVELAAYCDEDETECVITLDESQLKELHFWLGMYLSRVRWLKAGWGDFGWDGEFKPDRLEVKA